MFKLGIETLITENPDWLKKQKIALLAHPASTLTNLTNTHEALLANMTNLTCLFSPQHGFMGEKQDNMIESDHTFLKGTEIPIFSLYSETRRPTTEMFEHFDQLLFDAQDIGCRVYTYITTLLYMMEMCHKEKKGLTILDRPNPLGRNIEGQRLNKKWTSFVGAQSGLILQHGMTMGEIGSYFFETNNFDFEFKVQKMQGYNISENGGWPKSNKLWVNPSPNIPRLSSTRAFPGTVLIEGTTLSEGRGTTRSLELIGAPDLNIKQIMATFTEIAPNVLKSIPWRICSFEPSFQKHAKSVCHGIQLHCESHEYEHSKAQPIRWAMCFLKSLKITHPDYSLWRTDGYEYEYEKKAIDLICGDDQVRHWIEDTQNTKTDDIFEALEKDENQWQEESKKYHLY